MNRNKFNLKDKKTKIIISTIIIVLLLFIGIGLELSSMNNTDSKNIATQGQDKTDKKEESKKEDSTKEETNSSSDKKEDSTSEGTETSSKEESKSESSDTGSSSSNSEVANKPSSGGSSSSSSGSSSNGGNSNTSNTPSHTHSWNPITTTVHHDEVGHWEDVLIQDAWTEEVPVYEERELSVCNGCGKDITSDPWGHIEEQMLAGNLSCGGYHSEWKQVQVGTNKVNHGAVYDKKYVVDKAAWDETVITGYQCSCGATK